MSVNTHEYIERIKNETDVFSKAHLLDFLVHSKGAKVKHVAHELGLSSSYVCNLLRMLKLPELIRDGYYAQLISLTHLSVLSRLRTSQEMIMVYEEVLAQSMSSTQLDERVREILHGVQTKGDRLTGAQRAEIAKAIEAIDPLIKARVVQSRIRASVTIEMKGNFHETSRVLKKVGGL